MSKVRDILEDERVVPLISDGGTTDQVLAKVSNADKDVDWADREDTGVQSVTGESPISISGTAVDPIVTLDTTYDRVDAKGSVSGAVVCSVASFEVFTMTITGATTISFTGFPSGSSHKTVMLVINNGSTNMTFSGVEWPEGEVPELSTGRDRLVFASEDAGVNIDGSLAGIAYA